MNRAEKDSNHENSVGAVLLKAIAIGLLFFIALNSRAQEPEPFRISHNVDLILLEATVRDHHGRVATNLLEKNFEVYEEGVRQSIRHFRHEDVPVRVGLVVDHSGSMRQKLAEVVAGARSFVQFSNPDDEMFVVNFNEHVTLGSTGAIHFVNRSDELDYAISNSPTTGKTALYDAITKALDRLKIGNKDKKVLIVISDGADNSSKQTLPGVLKLAEQSGALIYTIGIFDEDDPDRNPGVLRKFARITGGESFVPKELSEVVAICAAIAREIRSQYTLGYFSANPGQPGTQRSLRVVARDAGSKKLIVRTRSSYIVGEVAPAASPAGVK